MSAVIERSAAQVQARAAMLETRNKAIKTMTQGGAKDGAVFEWRRLSQESRMIFLLIAGLDGEVSDIARKGWAEFTPPEQSAIRVAIRAVKREVDSVFALAML